MNKKSRWDYIREQIDWLEKEGYNPGEINIEFSPTELKDFSGKVVEILHVSSTATITFVKD